MVTRTVKEIDKFELMHHHKLWCLTHINTHPLHTSVIFIDSPGNSTIFFTQQQLTVVQHLVLPTETIQLQQQLHSHTKQAQQLEVQIRCAVFQKEYNRHDIGNLKKMSTSRNASSSLTYNRRRDLPKINGGIIKFYNTVCYCRRRAEIKVSE